MSDLFLLIGFREVPLTLKSIFVVFVFIRRCSLNMYDASKRQTVA